MDTYLWGTAYINIIKPTGGTQCIIMYQRNILQFSKVWYGFQIVNHIPEVYTLESKGRHHKLI